MMLAVKDAFDRGLFGRLLDVEVRLSTDTPWDLFAFLRTCRVSRSLSTRSTTSTSSGASSAIRPACTPRRSATPPRRWRRPAPPPSSTTATRCAARCRSTTTMVLAGGTRSESFASMARKAPRTPRWAVRSATRSGEPDELTIRAKGEWSGSKCRCTADGSPTPLSRVWRTFSALSSGEDQELVASVEDAWTTMALVEAAFKIERPPGDAAAEASIGIA